MSQESTVRLIAFNGDIHTKKQVLGAVRAKLKDLGLEAGGELEPLEAGEPDGIPQSPDAAVTYVKNIIDPNSVVIPKKPGEGATPQAMSHWQSKQSVMSRKKAKMEERVAFLQKLAGTLERLCGERPGISEPDLHTEQVFPQGHAKAGQVDPQYQETNAQRAAVENVGQAAKQLEKS